MPTVVQATEAVAENSAGATPSEHPGHNLSIPELCLALKVKLAQATDSQGYVPARGIFDCYAYGDF